MPREAEFDRGYKPKYNPFSGVRNSLNQAYNVTTKAIRQARNLIARQPETQAVANSLSSSTYVPPGLSQQQYYQVRRDDKDLMDVANKTGTDPKQLASINNTKTLPPVGSYLQLINQGVPASVASSLASSGTSVRTLTGTVRSTRNEGRGDPAAQSLRNQASQIAQQLANGQYPSSIPSAAIGFLKDANGQQMTLNDFIADGYTMNANGVLVRNAGTVTTSVGSGSAEFMNTEFMKRNVQNNTPFLRQLRWDPKRKRYVQIGTLIKEGKLDVKTGKFYPNGRNKKGKPKPAARSSAPAAAPAPVAPSNTEGPQTVLDIHLGSG